MSMIGVLSRTHNVNLGKRCEQSQRALTQGHDEAFMVDRRAGGADLGSWQTAARLQPIDLRGKIVIGAGAAAGLGRAAAGGSVNPPARPALSLVR